VAAAVVTGAVVKTGTVGVHAENAAQAGVNAAPSSAVAHHDGAHALVPAPLSRIAAARRSRIDAVWLSKSVVESPCVLLGAHAKPRRSTGAETDAAKARAASIWPETKSCIVSEGAAVQP